MLSTIARRRSFQDPRDRSPTRSPLWRLIAGGRSTLAQWVQRPRQRRALREIAEQNDFHLLKDIGVSQEEALQEAEKPFWRR
jgi:uncharacterized protein YjiS (DUF1127 family)